MKDFFGKTRERERVCLFRQLMWKKDVRYVKEVMIY